MNTRFPLHQQRSLTFDELSVGMSESFSHTVEEKDIQAFAEVSGDHNPLHLDPEYAEKTMFGSRIAHGLYTGALISGILGMRLPGPGAIYLSQNMQFRAPVRIGDCVTVTVTVSELRTKGSRVTLHCEAKTADAIVLTGEAKVMIPG